MGYLYFEQDMTMTKSYNSEGGTWKVYDNRTFAFVTESQEFKVQFDDIGKYGLLLSPLRNPPSKVGNSSDRPFPVCESCNYKNVVDGKQISCYQPLSKFPKMILDELKFKCTNSKEEDLFDDIICHDKFNSDGFPQDQILSHMTNDCEYRKFKCPLGCNNNNSKGFLKSELIQHM